VKLVNSKPVEYSYEELEKILAPYKGVITAKVTKANEPDWLKNFPPRTPIKENTLGAGIEKQEIKFDIQEVATQCGFIKDALATGGRDYTNPLWNLTTLIATFVEDGRAQAHRMGNQHAGYTQQSTDELFDRKEGKELGWPRCQTISDNGCKACQSCPHLKDGKSPLHSALAVRQKRSATAQIVSDETGCFVDPWADFVGPDFPSGVLSPTLADFVDAEHRAMGADRSAIAMAALTAVAAAMNATACVRIGQGWPERPIIWTALIGPPSAMKSPIIQKVTSPFHKIDQQRAAQWQQRNSAYQRAKAAGQHQGAPPNKEARCLVQDATPEKIAEILSRAPSGSLMAHDELAGWIGGFDRYGSGASARSFYLTCWNGGPFLRDRVGQGFRDDQAEIRVDNLALCVLGGIQPDRLAAIRDLTSDGLLQRFLPVLMRPAERGDEDYPVLIPEHNYERLIHLIQSTPPHEYGFAPDAAQVRSRVLDRLFDLEQLDGFSPALVGAIGKLKGYYGRIVLVLHVAAEHEALISGKKPTVDRVIPLRVAEAAERIITDFLLPHIFGLYDVIANGGKERDTVRAVAGFILSFDKDRLRPSDFTTGVRNLRGELQQKIVEWAGRFCALGWLRPEDETSSAPKAWLVARGLREHFADRRQQVKAARAAAHEILRAGGTRRRP
jgi:hypothetical protein